MMSPMVIVERTSEDTVSIISLVKRSCFILGVRRVVTLFCLDGVFCACTTEKQVKSIRVINNKAIPFLFIIDVLLNYSSITTL